MRNSYSHRLSLLALLAGLFYCVSAQAQNSSDTIILSTDGTMSVAAGGTLASAPAVSRVTLKLNPPPAPEADASFYDGTHKDLHQSLAWIQETNALAPTYWNLYTEARIRLQLQDYSGARASAERAYQLALKAMPASQEYVMLSAAVVARAHTLAKQ